MPVTKTKYGTYKVDIWIPETEKRIRRSRKTYREAMQLEKDLLKQYDLNQVFEPPKETRSMLDLIEIWHTYYGVTLKDGDSRKSKMLYCLKLMGNPQASDFSEQFFLEYREKKNKFRHFKKYG